MRFMFNQKRRCLQTIYLEVLSLLLVIIPQNYFAAVGIQKSWKNPAFQKGLLSLYCVMFSIVMSSLTNSQQQRSAASGERVRVAKIVSRCRIRRKRCLNRRLFITMYSNSLRGLIDLSRSSAAMPVNTKAARLFVKRARSQPVIVLARSRRLHKSYVQLL